MSLCWCNSVCVTLSIKFDVKYFIYKICFWNIAVQSDSHHHYHTLNENAQKVDANCRCLCSKLCDNGSFLYNDSKDFLVIHLFLVLFKTNKFSNNKTIMTFSFKSKRIFFQKHRKKKPRTILIEQVTRKLLFYLTPYTWQVFLCVLPSRKHQFKRQF